MNFTYDFLIQLALLPTIPETLLAAFLSRLHLLMFWPPIFWHIWYELFGSTQAVTVLSEFLWDEISQVMLPS